MKISGHLKGFVSYKNTQYIVSYVYTQYIVSYVYFNLFVYITTNFSFPLAIEMHGWPFPGHPYIESSTVLSNT